jgi:serine/threonine protein kinase
VDCTHERALVAELQIGPAGPLPETFGPYTLLGRLGYGGMGVVLDAMSPWGERVALKLTRLFLDRRQAEHIALRFHREARLLAQLDHPGIVPLRDAGIVDDLAYLALTRIEGASLRAIRRLGPLQLDVVARVGIRLARTLAHVHESGVVHRDIKPGNVLIDARGRPVLIDFGIATFVGATRITNRNDVLGTLGYIAPEVVDGDSGGALADQYSLGRVLHTLAASTALATAADDDARVGRILAGLDVDWSAFPTRGRWSSLQIVVQKMVAEDPAKRYPDLDACADALTAVTALDVHRAEDADRQLVMLARQSLVGEVLPPPASEASLATTGVRPTVSMRRTSQL